MEVSYKENKSVSLTITDTEENWKKLLGMMRTWSPGQRQEMLWFFTAVEEAVEPRNQGSGVEVPAYHLHDLRDAHHNASCVRCQVGLSDGPVYERTHP